jgi:hypothetical protein
VDTIPDFSSESEAIKHAQGYGEWDGEAYYFEGHDPQCKEFLANVTYAAFVTPWSLNIPEKFHTVWKTTYIETALSVMQKPRTTKGKCVSA